jgi:hypothetical protein
MDNTQLTLDGQFKKEADEALKFFKRGIFESLFYGLKLFRDKKYYTAYGYNSIEEFSAYEADLQRSQTFYYLKIADKLLPKSFDSEVHLSGLFSLGVSKLKVLCQLDDKMIEELKEKGTLTLSQGARVYAIKELKEMTVAELKALLPGLAEKIVKEISYVFQKVHNRCEKWLQDVVDNVKSCTTFDKADSKKIQLLIHEIADIFNRYVYQE